MPNALADTGPLVALFDKHDNHHDTVKAFLQTYRGTLFTTWPVITEVSHLLSYSVERQIAFLSWTQRGGLRVENLATGSIETILALTEKYRDHPMDLADASLVALAIQTGIRNILSLDSDFRIYRLPDKTLLRNLLTAPRKR